jgi:hypothetical protein
MIYNGNEKTYVGEQLERNAPALCSEIIRRRMEEAARAARRGSLYYLRGFLDDDEIPVNSLVDHGRDTILIAAVESGNAEKVKYVFSRGADIHAVTITRWSPLMAAAALGDSDMVRLLVECGARVNARDMKGKTALMLAASKGHAEVVEALVEAGSDPVLHSFFGHTALDYARRGQKRYEQYMKRKLERLISNDACSVGSDELRVQFRSRNYQRTRQFLRHARKVMPLAA